MEVEFVLNDDFVGKIDEKFIKKNISFCLLFLF
jgi:hypothetical protein